MEVFKDARQMAALSDPRIRAPIISKFLQGAARFAVAVELTVYEATTPEEIVAPQSMRPQGRGAKPAVYTRAGAAIRAAAAILSRSGKGRCRAPATQIKPG